jgi:beta-lactamase class A
MPDKSNPIETVMKYKTACRAPYSGMVNFARAFLLALFAFTSSCAVHRELKSSSSLQEFVNSELARFPGHAGVYVKNLKTGEDAGFRADEIFNSASVIKLPVAALVLEKAAHGELNLDERVHLRKEDVRIGTGVLQFHDPDLNPTLRDIVFEMIVTSDNTATDIAIGRAGGVPAVNAWIKKNGYEHSLHLNQTLGDCFLKFAPLFALSDLAPKSEDAKIIQTASRGIEEERKKVVEDREWWIGEITPRGIGRLLESAERRQLVSKDMSDLLIKMLDNQQGGACRLPHYLSWPTYSVAHKTGDWPPALANDVGIIYTPCGPIIVAFCANSIHGNYGEAEDEIGRFAQKLVNYFELTERREAEKP